MRPLTAAIRRTAIAKLSLPVIAFVLAFPIAAQSVEGTAYLAPRDREAAGQAVFEEAPADTGTPVDWRGGAPGTDAAEAVDRAAKVAVATGEALARGC